MAIFFPTATGFLLPDLAPPPEVDWAGLIARTPLVLVGTAVGAGIVICGDCVVASLLLVLVQASSLCEARVVPNHDVAMAVSQELRLRVGTKSRTPAGVNGDGGG